MNTRAYLNAGLLLLLLGLLVLVYVETQPKDDVATQMLPAMDQVTRIEIQLPGEGSELHLQKSATTWQLVAPIAMAADAFRVRSVLNVFATPSLQTYPLDHAALAQYGLAQPQVRVKLDDEWYVFGAATAVAQRRYLQQGERLHVIAEPELAMFTSGWAFFAERKLLPQDVHLLSLQLPGLGDLALQAGEWRLNAEAHVSQDDALALVQRWQQAQGMRVKADQGARVGEEPLSVTWDGGGREFMLWRDQREWVLRWPQQGVEYHLSVAQGQRLLRLVTADAE